MQLLFGSPSNSSVPTISHDDYVRALFAATNQDRQTNNLPQLTWDDSTFPVAINRASANSELPGLSLSHYDANNNLIFGQLLNSLNIPYYIAGENLAKTDVDPNRQIISQVEQALMNSPTHRANILGPTFHQMSIGDKLNGDNSVLTLAEIYR